MTHYQLMAIPNGPAGIRQTLKMMAGLSRRYSTTPQIRELALKIVQNVPEKSWKGELSAILKFVQHHIRYVKDVQGVETLQTPIKTLSLRQGDCDDKSTLAAALTLAIGHPVRFMAVGKVKGTYQHVFPQSKVGGKWLTMETTEYWPLGRTPSKIKSMMVEHL